MNAAMLRTAATIEIAAGALVTTLTVVGSGSTNWEVLTIGLTLFGSGHLTVISSILMSQGRTTR